MNRYYVNKNAQPTWEHEVHKAGCSHWPDENNMQSLWLHDNCKSAVRYAKKYYNDVDWCYWCTDCHTI